VGEEWRLLIELDADGALAPAADGIVAELGEEIGLHRAEGALVAYADTPQAARAAEHRLRRELEKRGLARLEPRVEHWSHEDQEWRDEAGSPTGPEDEAEDEDYEDDAEDDAAEEPPGTGPRTVVVSLSRHHEAKQLAEELRNEGWNASSSWHHVEISTRSPEEAASLIAELDVRAPDTDVWISA
jgi:hypothetical protein